MFCVMAFMCLPLSGYFVALMAFRWPDLVKSVVLVNSAGNVIPGYSPLPRSIVCVSFLCMNI